MSNTAIVLGATGAIGTQLVIQLSQRDDVASVILITRRELNLPLDFPNAITSKIHTHVDACRYCRLCRVGYNEKAGRQ